MLKLLEGSPEVTATLNPSRYLLVYLLTVHAAMLLSIAWYPLSTAASIFVVVIIVLHGASCLYRSAFACSPGRVALLEIYREGVWVTRRHCRERVGITSATVWNWLIVIRVANGGWGLRSVVILPDSCSADDHRRLRILLRHCLVAASE